MRNLLLIAILLFLSSCFISRTTENEPLTAASLETLRPGATTAAQVLEVLGAPTEVVQLGRRSAYRFDATATKSTGLWLLAIMMMNDDTRSDRVWVFFDENDVLTHVGATFDFRDPEYALPWSDVHDE
jgi:outer membrane protein assembly factor BamE (lipoprotein component of BamABCDE complex)